MKEYKTKILAIQYDGENKGEIVDCIKKIKYEVVSVEENDDKLEIIYIDDYVTFFYRAETGALHVVCILKKGDYLKIEGDDFKAMEKEEFEKLYKEI